MFYMKTDENFIVDFNKRPYLLQNVQKIRNDQASRSELSQMERDSKKHHDSKNHHVRISNYNLFS